MNERGDFAEWVPRWSSIEFRRVDTESEVLVLGQTSSKFQAIEHCSMRPFIDWAQHTTVLLTQNIVYPILLPCYRRDELNVGMVFIKMGRVIKFLRIYVPSRYSLSKLNLTHNQKFAIQFPLTFDLKFCFDLYFSAAGHPFNNTTIRLNCSMSNRLCAEKY